MEHLEELGCLALGSRLKRLSEQLAQEVAEVYKGNGIEFEPRWFPVFSYIANRGSASITAIADGVGITHPAVNQMAQELLASGLIEQADDPQDKRRRLLALSNEGRATYERLKPAWKVLHASVSDAMSECGIDLVNALAILERALDRQSLTSRYEQLENDFKHCKIEIKDLDSSLERHFARLNRAWIEKYFRLEKSDLDQFANPEKIVLNGGSVIFACLGDRVVGTCALKKKNDTTYEVIKMAVDEAYRGMGIGRLLMEECIKRAKSEGAKTLFLETNSRLKSAVSLYKRLGFEVLPEFVSPYERVDLAMEMNLDTIRHADHEPLNAANAS